MSGKIERLRRLTKEDMLIGFKRALKRGNKLFRKKLEDYGVDTFKTVGAVGLFLKAKEKFGRLENLLGIEGKPNYEAIRDNIVDLFVLLGVIMAMYEEGLVDDSQLVRAYRAVMANEVQTSVQTEPK